MAFSNPNPPRAPVLSAAQPFLNDVQTLKQQLDTALERIHEYEHALLHQATLSRQFFYSLRTQDSLICPNCKQAVAHTCSSAILRPPLSRYEHQPLSMLGDPSGLQIQGNLFGEHVAAQSSSAIFNASASHVQPPPPTSSNISPSSFFTSHSTNPYPTPVTLGNPAALQTHFTRPTAQGDFFGEHVVARSANTAFESFASHLQPLPPRSSDTSSVFTYHSTDPNPYHVTSLPFSTVSSPSRPTSFYPTPYPPRPSITINSQYNCSNNNSSLGKRDPHRTDLECKPERKRARQNLPEERANENQQSELYLSQYLDTSSLCLPSFNETTRSVSEVLPATSEDSADISEQGSEADWSIRYNSEVERALDVSFLRSMDVGQVAIHCLQFSKDGKYLAVACWGDNGMTNIYDVETGENTCTLKAIDENDAIQTLCFSPDGLYLATGEFSLVRIWEISRKYVRNVFRPSPDIVTGACIDFSPDGHLIAFGSMYLIIWNWRDGTRKTLERVEPGINDIRFSPNGQYIAAGMDYGSASVLIWNVRTGQLVEKLMKDVDEQWVCSIAFMPDGMGLVSAASRAVRLWDISLFGMDSSVSQMRNGGMEVYNSKGFVNFWGDGSGAGVVGISSNGRWAVICSTNRRVQVWNIHKAELHCEVTQVGFDDHLNSWAFSPVRDCLAHALGRSRVLLWRLKEVLD